MAPQTNGEVRSSSATLSHISGYPVINDALATFKKNPYGQKSIELGDQAYQNFAKPFLSTPIVTKPYQYVAPYVQKADHLGAGALNKIDKSLPVLKQPTAEILANGKQLAFLPIVKTKETTDHLFSVYSSEFKKVGGDGIVTYGKALVSTGLVITSETLNWIGDLLRTGKAKAKEASQEVQDAAH